MKNINRFFASVFAVVACCLFVSCSLKDVLVIKESDTYVVISVSGSQMALTGETTLADYMSSLKKDGQLDFETSDGMITSVNGIANPADWSSCWMLYTDDVENANDAWGTVEYQGKLYGSSMFGAESLKVKEGCLYIWVFQSFS